MAEYAGLEIRIGGNTTKLTNALKAPTKSAAELQSRIRQITKAMQFDPHNIENVATRIKITGDRMQSLQAKAELVKSAMAQLGDTIVTLGGKERSIRSIATETDNLSLAAKQADERYAKLTGSLATIYESWNKMSRNKGVDFARDQLGIDAKTADYLMRASTSLADFNSEVERINRERSTGLDTKHDIISPEQLATLREFKELNFHDMFKRGLDLDDVVQDARDLGVAISDSAVENVRDLQKAFKDASEEKGAFDKALQFEQFSTDIQRLDSEAENLSQTMRSLDDGMTSTTRTPWFQDLEEDVRRVDAALDNVERDIERTSAAMKVDPKNIELATRYMQDLQQKASLSEEKARLLNGELSHLEISGAKEAASSHEDLAKWIEESAESARVAKKELSEQQATVMNLDNAVKEATQRLANMKKDTTLAEASDNVQKLAGKTRELAKAEEDLAKERKKLDDNKSDFEEQKKGYEEATRKAEEYRKQLSELAEEQKRVRAIVDNADDPSVSADDVFAAYNRSSEIPGEFESLTTKMREAETAAVEFGTKMDGARKRIELSGQTISECETNVSNLKASVDKLEQTPEVELLKSPDKSIEKEERALEELKTELSSAKAEEKRRQDAYDSAAAENELAKEARAYDDVEQQIEDTRVKLLEAQNAMNGKSGGLLNPSTIKSLGMTLSATVTPMIGGIGRSMMEASQDIDSAYRDMRKTVDGTEEQFESLRQHAMEFSTTHVTSADQILEIEAIGGELGVATENLTAFAEAVSNIDVASNLDVEGAAETLGHLGNIMHLTEDDYEGFSNALVRLGNNGASTETEIANIAERIGSMGSIVGMSASDLLAWSSSIASTGMNAEAAGTAISKTMSFFETAVSAAGGTMDTSFEAIDRAVQEGGDSLTVFANLAGQSADEFAEAWETDADATFKKISESITGAKDSLQGIADVAHMTADEFSKTWESDPTAAMEAFIKGLNDIEASGGSADKVLQGFGITSVRQKQAIEGLMQTIDGLDDNLQMSDDAWNGISDKWGQAGDAANEAAKKAEGFSGQLQIMKNMWHNALSELGEGAAPWMQRFSGMLGTLTEAFSGLSSGAKEAIVALGGIAFATGPMLTLASTLITSKQNIMSWAKENVTGLSVVMDAYKNLGNEGVKALTGTSYAMSSFKLVAKELGAALLKSLATGAIIAGIVALGYALKTLYDRYQDHIAATDGLKEAISGIGDSAAASVESIGGVSKTLDELTTESGEYESRLADLARTIGDSNSQYSSFAGQMDYYADTIRELGGKSELTKDEAYKLEAALQGVNDACGTTYAIDEYGNIIDTQTGKIQDNTEALLANIDMRKQQALFDYYADDYAKATENWAEAQDRVNELEAKQKKLTSKEGRAEWIDNYIEKVGRADLAEEAYQNRVSQTETALEQSRTELARTEDAMTELEGKMGKAQESLDKAKKTLEDSAAAEEEYGKRTETVTADVTGNMKRLSDAVDEVGGDDKGFNAMAAGLEAIHASAGELNGVDMTALATAFDSANGSMAQVVQTLEDGGVIMSTWNTALEQAPGAAENMGSVTAAAFQSMYNSAGQNLDATMTLIAGLDMVQVGDKTFYIGDNGSITDSEGKVYDLKKDIDQIPDKVVTKVTGDNKQAQNKIKETESSLKKTDKKTARPTISAHDAASGVISDVTRRLNNLNGRVATTFIHTIKTGPNQATGGMDSRPVIPRHAKGYIATGPTLTNQGWIGEDGIEAVANWATGGAVVPLTNKRYMLPIADAIADGMSRRMVNDRPQNNITVTVTGVSGPDEVASSIARTLGILNL